MAPQLSIIVPIYNVESYLEECLASIVGQSLSNIEIILVNDASPDNSEQIIQNFLKDHRIIYIKHNINKGHGGALNTGLKKVSGDYCWLVDSDDFIDKNACEFLVEYALEHDVDALGIGAHNFYEKRGKKILCDEQKYTYPKNLTGKTMSPKEFITNSYIKNNFLPTPQWAYLFKSEAIKNFTFRENVAFEDHDSVPIIINSLSNIRCINYKPYFRRIHGKNSTSFLVDKTITITKKQMDQRLDIALSLLNYLYSEKIDKIEPIAYFVFRTVYIEIIPQWLKYTKDTKHNNELILKFQEINQKLKNQFHITNFHKYRRKYFGIFQNDDWRLFGENNSYKRFELMCIRILQGTYFDKIFAWLSKNR
jgi:glycosyltransferase involved in cell wall biosynthesis